MPVHAKCACGKQYLAADKHRGRRARCPTCGQQFYVCEFMLASYTYLQDADLPVSELYDPETKLQVAAPGAPAATTAAPQQPDPSLDVKPPAAGHQVSWRDYLYWIPLLTLVPLAFFLGRGADETVEEQLKRTLKEHPAEVRQKVEMLWEDDTVPLDEVILAVPGRKLIDAHVERDSQLHWLYALLALVGFGLLLFGMFRAGSANPLLLIGIALLSGTAGIGILLLAYEFIFVGDLITRAAEDPDSSFTFSLIGFTLGVGLFEESAKAIPVVYYLWSGGKLSWRAGFLWGFASGLGFGVSEGVTYAAQMYNGISSWEIYVVRFASCVALHAMWSGASGLLLARWGEQFQKVEKEWYELIGLVLYAIGIPAILHGAYDAMLSRDMYLGALMVGLITFGWLAWLVEERQRHEGEAMAVSSVVQTS